MTSGKTNPMLTPGKKAWHKGRASVSADDGESAVVQARVGDARKAKFNALGGAQWLRDLLDRTPMPLVKTLSVSAHVHEQVFELPPNHNRASLIFELRNSPPANGFTTIGHRVVGNHVWFLSVSKNGQKTIGLYLLSKGTGKEKNWTYKLVNESTNPIEIDCPLSLLAEADPPKGESIEWRSRVKNFHAHMKKRAKTCKPGAKVLIGLGIFTLVEKLGRKGWTVEDHKKKQFFLAAKTLAKCPFF